MPEGGRAAHSSDRFYAKGGTTGRFRRCYFRHGRGIRPEDAKQLFEAIACNYHQVHQGTAYVFGPARGSFRSITGSFNFEVWQFPTPGTSGVSCFSPNSAPPQMSDHHRFLSSASATRDNTGRGSKEPGCAKKTQQYGRRRRESAGSPKLVLIKGYDVLTQLQAGSVRSPLLSTSPNLCLACSAPDALA